jgi:hypothetical protein
MSYHGGFIGVWEKVGSSTGPSKMKPGGAG